MDPIAANRRTCAYLLLGAAVSTGVLPVLIGVVVGQWMIGILVGVVAGVVVAGVADRRADATVLRLAGARPASREQYQRLHNLVEGLCIANGVPKPEIHVLDSDAADAFAIGREPKAASLVVTSGLLEHLERIQLEGVIAHELAHIRQHDTHTSSLVAVLLGAWLPGSSSSGAVARLRQRLLGEYREALADAAGCQMTRYPPGLAGALERMASSTATVEAPVALAHLWVGRGSGDVDGLDTRIALLREG